MDSYTDTRPLLDGVKSTALLPVRVLTSPSARRTYIRTALLSLAALLLAGLAVVAYTTFYLSYIPQLGFSRPIHLDFDPTFSPSEAVARDTSRGHPAGHVDIRRGELIAGQAYDVRVRLHMPRAPINLDAGNFMLHVQLLTGPESTTPKIVAHARRPATLKYVSPMIEGAGKIATLGLYAAGWRDDSERVDVSLFDGVVFPYATDVPQRARVELRSDRKLWVYEASVDFRARFSGLRWLMYNYRIISFVLFTSLFWFVEIGTALTFWFVSSYLFAAAPLDETPSGKVRKSGATKREQDDDDTATEGLSDTSRQFPTFSRQPPLRFSAPKVEDDFDPPYIKAEDDDDDIDDKHPMVGAAAEADDEDEDEDADFVIDEIGYSGRGASAGEAGRSDSGLGTSMDSSAGSSSARGDVRRRKKAY